MHAPMLTEPARTRIHEILGRAVDDITFRTHLLEDPKAALHDVGLDDAEIDILSGMRRVALEEWGIDVRRFRAFLRDNGNKITPRPDGPSR